MSRETRLAERRKRKFERHAINIEEQVVEEERRFTQQGEPVTVKFTQAVYAGKQLIARATSRRYALKAAHNWIKQRS